ncbi:hypothetical protein ACJRO7_010353 [Eucalyptus globulus]|uniref:Uncharacterized protein n=1 Tax=Eucalyptus globulus TaxID=34317 RepID=A0ABD3LBR1_EUCGL
MVELCEKRARGDRMPSDPLILNSRENADSLSAGERELIRASDARELEQQKSLSLSILLRVPEPSPQLIGVHRLPRHICALQIAMFRTSLDRYKRIRKTKFGERL